MSESTLSNNLHSFPKQGGSAQKQSFENRDKFKDFFNSSAGKLPWTWRHSTLLFQNCEIMHFKYLFVYNYT